MTLKLLQARAPKHVYAVMEVINRFSGLITPKTFTQTKDCYYYFIVNQEEPIGIIGYRPLNKWAVEQINTVILPKYRGKGYGSQASEAMTEKLFKLGYGKVFCTVKSSNTVMLNIKKQLGFESEGLLKNHFGAGRHIYLLAKTKGNKKWHAT